MSTPIMSLKQTTMNMSSSTTNLISTSILNMSAPTININKNQFRFVPWTTFYASTAGSASLSTIVTGSTSNPSCNVNATIKYRYSIIGNTMYLNFLFYQTSAGSSNGSGYYQYTIPQLSTYPIDFTNVVSSTNGSAFGTRFGMCNFKTGVYEVGVVYLIGSGTSAKLILQAEAGSANTTYNQHSASYFQFATTGSLYVGFEANLPLI
jgi:hypothetical protein